MAGTDTAVADKELEKHISRLLARPNTYDYPQPKLYMSDYGYKRARCPDCGADTLVAGFNSHYTKVHRPDNDRQKAKAIIQAVRSHDAKINAKGY